MQPAPAVYVSTPQLHPFGAVNPINSYHSSHQNNLQNTHLSQQSRPYNNVYTSRPPMRSMPPADFENSAKLDEAPPTYLEAISGTGPIAPRLESAPS
ncbi:hypothetical protein BGZ76_006108 [Entomortierella beljakovae]|nr:hypothetical protein BGZ76_006108 [Entomortierella beljakovae]